jgi:hypothetical protein
MECLNDLHDCIRELREEVHNDYYKFNDELNDFIRVVEIRLERIESMLSDQQKEVDDLNIAITRTWDGEKN